MDTAGISVPVVEDQRKFKRSKGTRYDREMILEQKLLQANAIIEDYISHNTKLNNKILKLEKEHEKVKKRLRLFNSIFKEHEIEAQILDLKNRGEFNSNPSFQENSSYE